MHLESVDLSHNNLVVILLLPTAPRLRFIDLTENCIGGLIMHESKRFRIDSKEYEQSAIVGASGATTEPNHWNYSNEHWKVGFF